MAFVLRGFQISLAASDGFSKLLAAGLSFGFALQTFVIVGGILRVIPLTGITLPFVSYGGSSVVSNFFLSGRADAHLEQGESRQGGCRVNTQLRHLAVFACLLIAVLIGATMYWQSWAGGELANRQGNAVQLVAQLQVDRGTILAVERIAARLERPAQEGRHDDVLPPLHARTRRSRRSSPRSTSRCPAT